MDMQSVTTQSGGTIVRDKDTISITNQSRNNTITIQIKGNKSEVARMTDALFQEYASRGQDPALDPTTHMDITGVCAHAFKDPQVTTMFQKCLDENQKQLNKTLVGNLVSDMLLINHYKKRPQQDFNHALSVLKEHPALPQNEKEQRVLQNSLQAWATFYSSIHSNKIDEQIESQRDQYAFHRLKHQPDQTTEHHTDTIIHICQLASQGVEIFQTIHDNIQREQQTLAHPLDVSSKPLSMHIEGTPLTTQKTADEALTTAQEMTTTFRDYLAHASLKLLEPSKQLLNDVSNELTKITSKQQSASADKLHQLETGLEHTQKLQDLFTRLIGVNQLLEKLETAHLGGPALTAIQEARAQYTQVKEEWNTANRPLKWAPNPPPLSRQDHA